MIASHSESIAAAQGEPEQLEQLGQRAVEKLDQLLCAYLEELRRELEPALLQAVFQLVTQSNPEAYNGLAPEQRSQLRSRISELCQRCSCLLTVEQLAVLAMRLRAGAARPEGEEAEQQENFVDADLALPNQPTISLSLEAPNLLEGFDPLAFCPKAGPADESLKNEVDVDFEAEEAMGLFTQLLQQSSSIPPATASLLPPTSALPMPREPYSLMRWLRGWELALQRRLRNLSHAVNLELMRCELSNGLAPLPLLDAVLSGQFDSASAPANLLRLILPSGDSQGGHHPTLQAVLLRVADLDEARLPLRELRREIAHFERTLLRMARKVQHWKQRLNVLHAEQLWLEDNNQLVQRGS